MRSKLFAVMMCKLFNIEVESASVIYENKYLATPLAILPFLQFDDYIHLSVAPRATLLYVLRFLWALTDDWKSIFLSFPESISQIGRR
jgi:hypothetical protein